MSDTAATQNTAKPVIKRTHLSLFVRDPEASAQWFADVLDMQITARGPQWVFLSFGRKHHDLALIRAESGAQQGGLGLQHYGLEIDEPVGNMVVDVGGGTTEVAVISLGGIVVAESVRTGGYELDEAIAGYIKREHGIAIGQQTAEDIKLSIGSACPIPGESSAEVRGRDLVSGLPKSVMLTADEVRGALEPPLVEILDAVSKSSPDTPVVLITAYAEPGAAIKPASTPWRANSRFSCATKIGQLELPEKPITRNGAADWTCAGAAASATIAPTRKQLKLIVPSLGTAVS